MRDKGREGGRGRKEQEMGREMKRERSKGEKGREGREGRRTDEERGRKQPWYAPTSLC